MTHAPPLAQPANGAGPPYLGAPHVSFGADQAERLRWAHKMETLSRLTARVVHELGNQAMLMIGGTAKLREEPLPPSARATVEELHRAAERVGALMRQWLTLGRKDAPALQRIDLNSLVAEQVSLLRVGLGHDVELITDLRAAPAWVLADRSHVEQVLLNLVVNARDALGGPGKIVVRTANAELSGLAGDYRMAFTPGPYVMLSVRDTGCGMDRATLARLFDAHFTTKERGKGSGMGLHHVWEVVKECGGTIQVASAPGQGALFAVYLPLAPESAAPEPVLPSPTAPGTVLVVEDEEAVRGLVREVLAREGYTVLEAADGREALEVCAAYAGRVDLLLTDCVLPQLGGGDLARQLRESWAGLKVLYMSGYPPNEPSSGADLGAPFLQKPFLPGALVRLVRETLAAKPA